MDDLVGMSGDEALAILKKLVQKGQVSLEQIQSCQGKVRDDKHHPTPKNAAVSHSKKGPSQRGASMTRHIALLWHYDGSTYSGLAENIDCSIDNSVEKHLFAALLKTCLVSSADRKECHYSRCGRTDKGVSAFGQLCALRVRSAFPIGAHVRNQTSCDLDPSDSTNELMLMQEFHLPKNSIDEVDCFVSPKETQKIIHNEDSMTGTANVSEATRTEIDAKSLIPKKLNELKYDLILNGVLPPSIRILGWCPVSDDFSARFSAVHRTYRYFFVRRNLNLHLMQLALNKMIGRHDFRNLCKINLEEVDNFERVILHGTIVKSQPWEDHAGSLYDNGSSLSNEDTYMKNGEENPSFRRQLCHVQITGQAFLWHQIRHIMAVLFMVGNGLETPSVIDELLDIHKNPGKPSYFMAPDLPLVLHSCGYNNLTIGRSVRNLWNVSCDLETKWGDLALASERVRNGLDSLRTEAFVRTDDLVAFINNYIDEKGKKSKRSNKIDDMKNITLEELGQLSNNLFICWGEALNLIQRFCGVQPSPQTSKPCLHIPLMERSRGSTYDEKVESILTPSTHEKRRRERFEENIMRKKKNTEEDAHFFDQKIRQGGSCI